MFGRKYFPRARAENADSEFPRVKEESYTNSSVDLMRGF